MSDTAALRPQPLHMTQGQVVTAVKPVGQVLKPQTSGGHQQRQGDVMYMSELLSYSLERLRKVKSLERLRHQASPSHTAVHEGFTSSVLVQEPEVLKAEKEQLERNLQTTAVSQYTAFLDAANCLTSVSNELSAVCEHLDSLLQATPELATACESFASNSAAVQEQFAHNKQLAISQSTIMELLEVPQLMDTCVRNGVYDEALDLQSFISRVGLLHPDVPVVKLLLRQVAEVGRSMLQQLLGRLRTNIQLPECLRVMGYLRRIGAFSEAELRLQFLQCRDEWISSLLSDLDDSDSYEYVKHLTDVHRLHLFDAVMQYRAIFFDTAPTASAGAGVDPSAAPANLRETAMLYSWVQHRVNLYLEQLRKHLPAITEGGNLASVIEHCMYCGSSLSRVGLDFQALLLPLFEACGLQLFATHLSSAVDGFNLRLESHKWVAMPTPVLGRGRTDRQHQHQATAATAAGEAGEGAVGEGEAGAAATASAGTAAEDESGPPYVIMEHLPLAVYVNGVLTALNELRHCALLSISKPLAGLLQTALEHAAGSLVHYRHTHALNASELPLFKAATRCMLDVVLPFLVVAFSRVFPAANAKVDSTASAGLLRQLLAEM
ncbi:component of oligomeric golgi complex 8 [Volvox carteri f. nagariensis]|uniref:Conserved oligomeric Golgi complex subunit 8 n=1 Tax=Volvox carteri f. nagariensis TaxID=3068 RepID=D8TJA8_VOLCA|nr:component of oligomeric golgi complex 8 [Volvox carteri f. nagariensis]EFJ52509.1 component of oligomeric golgi complex 8 [Volvox carteri f. nagariensis]|eukprot:XP_002946582.1 component of oligomeric golgi complex 8 [Volvox carteri f. nagariensis]